MADPVHCGNPRADAVHGPLARPRGRRRRRRRQRRLRGRAVDAARRPVGWQGGEQGRVMVAAWRKARTMLRNSSPSPASTHAVTATRCHGRSVACTTPQGVQAKMASRPSRLNSSPKTESARTHNTVDLVLAHHMLAWIRAPIKPNFRRCSRSAMAFTCNAHLPINLQHSRFLRYTYGAAHCRPVLGVSLPSALQGRQVLTVDKSSVVRWWCLHDEGTTCGHPVLVLDGSANVVACARCCIPAYLGLQLMPWQCLGASGLSVMNRYFGNTTCH